LLKAAGSSLILPHEAQSRQQKVLAVSPALKIFARSPDDSNASAMGSQCGRRRALAIGAHVAVSVVEEDSV
jgi:hypothetical protein